MISQGLFDLMMKVRTNLLDGKSEQGGGNDANLPKLLCER